MTLKNKIKSTIDRLENNPPFKANKWKHPIEDSLNWVVNNADESIFTLSKIYGTIKVPIWRVIFHDKAFHNDYFTISISAKSANDFAYICLSLNNRKKFNIRAKNEEEIRNGILKLLKKI